MKNINIFLRAEHLFTDSLIRDKYSKLYHGSFNLRRILPSLFKFKMSSLLNEYKIGTIMIILVNLLLAILNVIDINFAWLNFDTHSVDNLAFFVHEGTFYLIVSIILSMIILLYFFRGNLNFYKKNRILKYGAYFWLFQNGILAVSLALRNYYYISYYYALSYKRIGLMIFLILTFVGLVSMILKLKYFKTLFFIIKFNSWSVFIIMLITSSINWDYNIASFNLNNPEKQKVDYSYLFTLSDEVLPLLNNDQKYINKDILVYVEWGKCSLVNGVKLLNNRISSYKEKYEIHSWLSWNYKDYKTYHILKDLE